MGNQLCFHQGALQLLFDRTFGGIVRLDLSNSIIAHINIPLVSKIKDKLGYKVPGPLVLLDPL